MMVPHTSHARHVVEANGRRWGHTSRTRSMYKRAFQAKQPKAPHRGTRLRAQLPPTATVPHLPTWMGTRLPSPGPQIPPSSGKTLVPATPRRGLEMATPGVLGEESWHECSRSQRQAHLQLHRGVPIPTDSLAKCTLLISLFARGCTLMMSSPPR